MWAWAQNLKRCRQSNMNSIAPRILPAQYCREAVSIVWCVGGAAGSKKGKGAGGAREEKRRKRDEK